MSFCKHPTAHPSGPRTSFKSPKTPDELCVKLATVVCVLNQKPTLGARNNYPINLQQLEEIENIFSQN